MYATFLLILALLFTWVSWSDLRFGIFVIAGALPSYLLRFEIAGIPMTFLEAMILILIGIWTIRLFQKTQKCSLPPKPWRIPIILILIAAGISTIVSPNHTAALGILKAYFVEPFLLFSISISVLRTKDLFHLFTAFGIGALVVSSIGIAQFFTGLGIPAPWDTERRITSFFPYPNAVGLYLGPILTLGIVLLWNAVKQKIRWNIIFWGAVVVLAGVAIVLAKTEAAYVAVTSTLFLLSLFQKDIRRWTIPIAIMGSIIILAIPTVREPVIQKITLQDYSGQVRLSQWKDTVKFLKDNALLGAGLSGYPQAIAPYHSRSEIEIFQYPHNIFLNFWVEMGLLGLIGFTLLGVALRKTISTLQALQPPAPIFAAALSGALLEMFIHGLVDVPYFKNDLSTMTWLLLSALVVIYTQYVPQQKHR